MLIQTIKWTELYNLLSSNPINAPVKRFERQEVKDNLILVDYIKKNAIKADDAMHFNYKEVQITLFTKKAKNKIILDKFMDENFINSASYSFNTEDELFMTIYEVNLSIIEDN